MKSKKDNSKMLSVEEKKEELIAENIRLKKQKKELEEMLIKEKRTFHRLKRLEAYQNNKRKEN